MKLKKWKLLTVLLAVLMLATAATMTVYAYFSTRVYVYTNDGNTELAHLGMNLQLLFGKLDDTIDDDTETYPDGLELKIPYYSVEGGFNVYHTGATGDCPKFDPAAAWGSPQNPYIIANERHLQNLSALQSIGYFDLMYIEKNFTASGSGDDVTYTYNNGVSMPYFLVCTEAGTPVVIDATKIGTIRPIGSAEHPFIGVIGGAPISGSTYIDTNANKTQDTGEKTTTVSTLHNVKVQTTTDQTDVGLFGYVGFLGDEPLEPTGTDDAGKPIYATEFMGATSVLQNLLLSDVQVIVENPSITEIISKFFGKYWETDFSTSHNHRFSYTNLQSTDNPIPEENHHIGIFVGHVSYASVENINVYYSSNSIYAIDLTHTQGDTVANYHTASGILGFMYNMNADVVNQTTTTNNTTTISANCLIKMGTGTSTDDMEIPVAGSGSGTGGGIESGNGRGYVTAAEIFSKFNNVDTSIVNNELLWNYLPHGASTMVTGAILIIEKSAGQYTLADGKTSATISNGTVTAGGNTWTKYFIRTGKGTDESPFEYVAQTGEDVYEYELSGNIINGKEVWRYEAGGDAIWHYGIRVNFDGTKYTLADGGETVTLATSQMPVTATATIKTTNANNEEVSTTYVWEDFFIVDTRTNEAFIYDLFTAGDKLEVTSFNRKPLDLILGKNADGTVSLCTEWMRETIIGSIFGGDPVASGMYYFTDGVFTFALSSKEDSIRDTWENDKAPTIHLGNNAAADWQIDPSTDKKAVAAFLKPVTSNQMLHEAQAAGKQIYITAQPNTGTAGDVFLMSLVNSVGGTDITSITSGILNFDGDISQKIYKAYTEDGYTTMPRVPNKAATGGYSDMGLTLDELLAEYWTAGTQNKILNIGLTSGTASLEEVRERYNIIPEALDGVYHYFRNDNNLPVTPNANGTIPVYELFENGYFYYMQTGTTAIAGWPVYSFYYQNPDGTEPVCLRNNNLATGIGYSTTLERYIGNYLTDGGDSESGEPLYTYADQGITTPIPILNMDSSAFHSGEQAYVDGLVLARETDDTENYYYWDATDGLSYNYRGTKIDDTTGLKRINRYPTYTFSDYSEEMFLRILHHYTSTNIIDEYVGDGYSIWAGSEAQMQNLTYYRGDDEDSTQAILVFNSQGYCNIRYTVNNASRYVNYVYDDVAKTATFNGANNNADNGTKLYVYTIEGVLDMDYGVNKFIPKDDTAPTLSADSVVFWPLKTYTQNGYNSNTGYGSALTTGTDGYTAASATTPDPTYQLIPLVGNPGEALNWGTSDGYMLGDGHGFGLHQKFCMADQAGFGTMYNILGGNWEPGAEGTMLVAPIGSNGVEATIPKGCVAFRVNTGGTNTVRVIVAVPTTEKYRGETGFEIDLSNDYYIGVWNVAAANEGTTFEFNKADALEKFELPRSYTFQTEQTPETMAADGFQDHVVVSYGGKEYRTYLNGGCVLVAYEFTVTGEGVYIIGSVHGTNNTVVTNDMPMEIVHFSVSGTASAGRDGVAGSKLGSVDFVYDDGTSIVTMDKIGLTGGLTNEEGNENYANYYASQALLHTNNSAQVTVNEQTKFVEINDVRISIRRYVKEVTGADSNTYGQTTITYVVGPPDSTQEEYIIVNPYMLNADAIVKEQESATP